MECRRVLRKSHFTRIDALKECIVITGVGVVSAIGCGKADTLDALRSGRSGVGPVRYLETSLKEYPVGEVPLSNAQMAALTGAPASWPRTTLMSILAIREALAEAGLRSMETPDQVGGDGASRILVSGTTVGAMDLTEKIYPEYSPDHSCGACTDLAALFVGGFEHLLLVDERDYGPFHHCHGRRHLLAPQNPQALSHGFSQ